MDIVFRGARVAVEVRGCYWHGCPEHCRRPKANSKYWNAKISRNMARDKDMDRRLADAGWTVVLVWEHEDSESAAQRVIEAVRAGKTRCAVH